MIKPLLIHTPPFLFCSMRRLNNFHLSSCTHFFFFRYFLQPRENGGKSVKVEELGSLRLNIVYTEDHVFPSEHYTPLRDLLLHSADVGVRANSALALAPGGLLESFAPCLLLSRQPVSASTAHILGEVCREKQEAAIPLVRLFLHYGRIVPFISAIAHAEINRTQWVWLENAA